jgi:hypothetical protein
MEDLVVKHFTEVLKLHPLKDKNQKELSKKFAELFMTQNSHLKLTKNSVSGQEKNLDSKLKCKEIVTSAKGSKVCGKLVKDLNYTFLCPTHTIILEQANPEIFIKEKFPTLENVKDISKKVKELKLNAFVMSSINQPRFYLFNYKDKIAALFISCVDDNNWTQGIFCAIKYDDSKDVFVSDFNKNLITDMAEHFRIKPFVSTIKSEEITKGFEKLMNVLILDEKDNIVFTKSK